MHLKLKRIAPLQAGKLLGAFYGIMSLIFVPFFMIFMALGRFAAQAQGGANTPPALPLVMGMGVIFILFVPVIYAAMGFVFGALAAFIYNLLAKWLGGFALEFEAETPPPAASVPLPP